MRRIALVWLLCGLSVPGVDAAPAKARQKAEKPKGPPSTLLIIWGGGPQPGDADAAAVHFAQAGFSSSEPLVKLFSSDVKGLNPGFHIAVLGACPKPEAEHLLRRVRRFYSGAYLRPVPREGAVAELKCPSLETWGAAVRSGSVRDEKEETTTTKAEEEVRAGKLLLHLELTDVGHSNGDSTVCDWSAVAELRRGAQVLDSRTFSSSKEGEVWDFGSSVSSVVLETTDFKSSCETDLFFDSERVRRTFRIAGKKMEVTEKVIARKSGLCPPSQEGMPPCLYDCFVKQYQAAERSCSGATAEECRFKGYDPESCRCDSGGQEVPEGD